MRKISSILTLLLLCLCGNLSAQTRLTNIADGVYYLVCSANSGYAYYDGENQYLRRTATDQDNAKFTITQGEGEYEGWYTIQTSNGNYVVAGSDIANHSTAAGTNVKVVASGQETNENKWWAFTVDASNASWVDIFPKQATLTTTTPAWNFASDHNGANQAVGLYDASNGNSNWLLVTPIDDFNPNRVISLNFGSGSGNALFCDGINKVPAAAWNNLPAGTNSNGRGDLVTWNGTAPQTLSPNWSVNWSAGGTYNYTNVNENIIKGYLDDGSGVTINLSNLPFTTGYDVYIYRATDTPNYYFSPITVTMQINGNECTKSYTTSVDANGIGYFGTDKWGRSRNATSVMGTNVICIKGLNAQNITIKGIRNGDARGCIAAVQIVETGVSNVINVPGDTYDASGVTTPVYLAKNGDLTIVNATPEIRSKIDVTGVTGTVTFDGYVNINYTLTDPNDAVYEGTYNDIYWADQATECPPMNGVTFDNKVFTKTSSVAATLTADISFPFPVCTNGATPSTGIKSDLGGSMWFAKNDNTGDYVCATNEQNTTFGYRTQDNFKWYIYPSFADGQFSFKIKHNNGKYIPSFAEAQEYDTKNYLVEEASAGTFYYMPCTQEKSGFSINADGAIFLTINTSGTDKPIWSWNKVTGNATHTGSNLTFPRAEVTLADLQVQLATYQGIEKFIIPSGSIVVGPNEFANPTEINAAIDAANNVNTSDAEAILTYLEGEDCAKLKLYQNKLAEIGQPLANVQFLMKGTYGTLILPCAAERPAGLKYYTCAQVNGTALVLVEHNDDLDDKTPYIVEQISGEEHDKYAIVGWNRLANTDPTTYTIGRLTGVLTEGGATVPDGGYILARNTTTGKQGFFLTNGTVKCPQYKCYLTVGGGATAPKELYFDNEGTTTGIEAIFGGENEEVVIYDLSGKRLSRLQKGVNIVNGHKVIVK